MTRVSLFSFPTENDRKKWWETMHNATKIQEHNKSIKIMMSEAISWTAGSKADGQKREK